MRAFRAWCVAGLTGVAAAALAAEKPQQRGAAKPAPAPVAAPAGKSGGAPSLDELLNLPAPKKQAPPGGKAPATPHPPTVKVAEESSGDTFEMAVLDMKQAAGRLNEQADAGIATQRAQERAVRRLDQLIHQLQQQNKNPKNSSQQKQDQGSKQNAQQPEQSKGQRQDGPVSDSNDQGERKGKIEDGKRNEEPLTEKLSEWGNLPPRLRDQLLQGMEDRFSTIYKNLTERYYKRLAEEASP